MNRQRRADFWRRLTRAPLRRCPVKDRVKRRFWVAQRFSAAIGVFLPGVAAKRRQNAAHGVSRGLEAGRKRAPQGRKILQQISAGPKYGLRAFCRPAGAWSSTSLDPRLTPWAAFWRRFAAAYIERRLTSVYPTNKACSTLLLLTVLTALSGCRQDMHDQPRFKPLRESDFYADLRSARPPVEGTVARGQLHEDAYFYGGKIGNNPGDYMPFAVTADGLAPRPETDKNYFGPWHSHTRGWNGTVVQHGVCPPPSLPTDPPP